MRLREKALRELLQRAFKTFDALTEDQKIHQRHLQKISFAAGNVAIDDPEPLEYWKDIAQKMAGPCPCGDCRRH